MHAVSNGQEAHSGAVRTEHGERSATYKAPASRRGEGIDPGLMTGDTDTPGRNSAPRHGKTRRHQRFWKSAEIGEARDEAEKINGVSSRDVQVDRLLGRQAVRIANFREVRAILSTIADGDFPMARLAQSDLVKAVEIGMKTGLKFSMA